MHGHNRGGLCQLCFFNWLQEVLVLLVQLVVAVCQLAVAVQAGCGCTDAASTTLGLVYVPSGGLSAGCGCTDAAIATLGLVDVPSGGLSEMAVDVHLPQAPHWV